MEVVKIGPAPRWPVLTLVLARVFVIASGAMLWGTGILIEPYERRGRAVAT